jgi:hypothetical protein
MEFMFAGPKGASNILINLGIQIFLKLVKRGCVRGSSGCSGCERSLSSASFSLWFFSLAFFTIIGQDKEPVSSTRSISSGCQGYNCLSKVKLKISKRSKMELKTVPFVWNISKKMMGNKLQS